MSFVRSFPLPVVLFGAPVLGKVNPYLVVVSRERLVEVAVEVGEAEAPSARLRGGGFGWRLELALKSFVDVLSARLEQPLSVEISVAVRGVSYPPSAGVYAVATLALVEAVAEEAGYSLEPDEVLEAASSVDREAAVWLDYLDGLRAAALRGRSLVYRSGEEPVELGLGRAVLELVGEQDIGEDVSPRLSDAVLTEAARLTGLSVVEAVSALRRGEAGLGDVFPLAARVDDAVFYLLYGAEPAGEGCKLTPSLQRVYGVCMAGRKLGDPVEFSL